MISGETGKSQMVADHVEAEIRSGVLQPGARIAGMRSLASRFKVSFTAVNHAYKKLERKGMIVRMPRSGTVVNPALAVEQTKLFALVTSTAYSDIENYYESLYSIAGTRRIVPMTGLLGKEDDWRQVVKDIAARRPDCVVVDLEARHFPLSELISLLGPGQLCFFNRWEWMPERPERAVLTDYESAHEQGFRELYSKGRRRILVVVHHRRMQPYLVERLKRARRNAGFRKGDPMVETVSFEEISQEPSLARSKVESFGPDAALGMNDYVLVQLEQLCPETGSIDRIGFFDTVHSRRHGREFSSFRINYREMWEMAIESFQPGKPQVRLVMPELIRR